MKKKYVKTISYRFKIQDRSPGSKKFEMIWSCFVKLGKSCRDHVSRQGLPPLGPPNFPLIEKSFFVSANKA